MNKNPRCLYESSLHDFLSEGSNAVFGDLCARYHGDALTTTREAWLNEIKILLKELLPWKCSNG